MVTFLSSTGQRSRCRKKKQVGADHADKRHQAAEKCIQEGDFVLLEKRKENKLSPHYEKEPYQVTACHGDQVQLKSPQDVQYRGKGTEPCRVSEVPNEQMCGQEPASSQEMGASAGPVDNQSPIQQPLLPRRSGRVTRPPERFSDYVTT